MFALACGRKTMRGVRLSVAVPVVAAMGVAAVLAVLAISKAVRVAEMRRGMNAVSAFGGSAFLSDVCDKRGEPYGPFVMPETEGCLWRAKNAVGREWFADVVYVHLAGSRVTDDDLAVLTCFPALQVVDLSDTKINDRGLLKLQSLRRLRMVCLHSSDHTGAVTEDGFRALQRAIPDVRTDLDFEVERRWRDIFEESRGMRRAMPDERGTTWVTAEIIEGEK